MCDCCCKLLYSIGAWADNSVEEIKFIPKHGNQISWTVSANTLNPSNPSFTNHWNMQAPITSPQFPIFPLKVCRGDKFTFTFNNDINTPNAFACAANIDGILYKSSNNNIYPIKIILQPDTGFTIVKPTYNPITDLPTRNIIDTINYISVSPNTMPTYTLTWILN